MSSMLASPSITQCMNFYSIRDNQVTFGADKDLFIGRNMHITLTIPHGETYQLRDIVVLGKLTLRPGYNPNTTTHGTLIARDVFFPGDYSINNVNLIGRNIYEFQNVKQFKRELKKYHIRLVQV